MSKAQAGKDLWATLKTSEGDIVVKLFSKDAPKTVANFVGPRHRREGVDRPARRPAQEDAALRRHRLPPRHPRLHDPGRRPHRHRHGRPGLPFDDEFQSGRKFDKTGMLAMANAGPNTNGSQFFITTSTPDVTSNDQHTIFGEVV